MYYNDSTSNSNNENLPLILLPMLKEVKSKRSKQFETLRKQ